MKAMNFNDITRKQFKEMEYFKPTKPFTDIVIVPTDDIHDSGYRCMKFVLWNCVIGEISGVVGGGSDVLHFNGIGGRGKSFNNPPQTPIAYKIDCLRKSGYLRIMTDHYLEVDDYSFSDFSFYVGRCIYERVKESEKE